LIDLQSPIVQYIHYSLLNLFMFFVNN